MPIGSVIAQATNGGLELLARGIMEGLAWKLTHFRVGSGGHDPLDPTTVIAIDPLLVEIIGPDTYPMLVADPEPIDLVQYANDSASASTCRISASEAIITVSEWGIYATILDSPLNPPEVGTRVLFAVSHRPMIAKTTSDVLIWRLVVQF